MTDRGDASVTDAPPFTDAGPIPSLALSALPGAIVVLDHQGAVTAANQRAAEVFGYESPAALRGVLAAHILSGWQAPGPDGRCDPQEAQGIRGDRSVFPIEVAACAYGSPPGAIVLLRDLTQERQRADDHARFIDDAVHELRSPLAALAGFAFILGEPDPLPPDQASLALAGIKRQGERARTLIHDMLDLTRLERGDGALDRQRVSLGLSVSGALEVAPVPEGKRVEVDVPEGIRVDADPGRMEQILVNLIRNAYRFGGDTVCITASEDDQHALLSVSDDGPGLQDDLVADPFRPFRRGAHDGPPGSGLGLAIVKKLVEMQGGEVWYEVPAGGGARFNLRLRKAAPV